MISYKELIKKTMPAEKKEVSKGCLLSYYLLRPIENLISILFIELYISAMAVTTAGMLFLIIALVSFLLLQTKTGVIIGLVFIFMWNICDGIDGNIARYTDTCSKRGELWDNVCDYMAPCIFYIGMGITAYNCADMSKALIMFSNKIYFVFMGFLIAWGHIFSRLIMYRKMSIFGESAGKGLSAKIGKVSVLSLIIRNITSVNGLAFLAFIVCYGLSVMEYCIIFYFCIYACIVVGSLYRLLKVN